MAFCTFASLMILALAATGSPPLPPGMARADDPQAVAALYSRPVPERARPPQEAGPEKQLTDQEAYEQRRIAYLAKLQELQHERRLREQELELEREARLRAEQRAAELERQRHREAILAQHQIHQAYQEWFLREQRREQWRKLMQERHRHCPKADPQPAVPTPQMPVSSGAPGSDGQPSPDSTLP